MPIHQIQRAKPLSQHPFVHKRQMCAGWKKSTSRGTMGILCQSACDFLLPQRPQSQQHSCGHAKKPQTDKETDMQTNKGRWRWATETNEDEQWQWLVLTVFDLSQLFLHCPHLFLCSALFVSVTHIKVSKVETMAKERAADRGKKTHLVAIGILKTGVIVCLYA